MIVNGRSGLGVVGIPYGIDWSRHSTPEGFRYLIYLSRSGQLYEWMNNDAYLNANNPFGYRVADFFGAGKYANTRLLTEAEFAGVASTLSTQQAQQAWQDIIGQYPDLMTIPTSQDLTKGAIVATVPSTGKPTVGLANLTTGNSAVFYVGDKFRITITGPVGQLVVGSANVNNNGKSSSNYGNISSSGILTIDGQFKSEHIGSWVETWEVGGVPAEPSVLMFVCAEKPGPGSSASESGAGAPSSGAGTVQSGAGETFSAIISGPMAFLKGEMISGVPNWALLLVAGGGLYFVSKGR